MWKVVLPYTRVSVVGGVMLGLGRALGETMAVTFVIGKRATASPRPCFAPGSTIASSLANEFTEAVGDMYVSALILLGLILFVITFIVLAAAKLMLQRLAKKIRRRERDFDRLRTPPVGEPRRHRPVAGCHRARARRTRLDPAHALHQRAWAASTSTPSSRPTPPPGSSGGLLNAHRRQRRPDSPRHGGRPRRSASWPVPTSPSSARTAGSPDVTRFVSDVLLSAPLDHHRPVRLRAGGGSAWGHFSGIAGAAALAVIAIPIIVRTTEDMLTLVPSGLREAAIALGAPRWRMIVQVAYRAAKQGILTGILLANSRA